MLITFSPNIHERTVHVVNNVRLGLPKDLFPADVPVKILKAILVRNQVGWRKETVNGRRITLSCPIGS